jgi:hypothetical protein
MTMGRYVLLLLGSPGAAWVEALERRLAGVAWAAELIACEHPHEACARLTSGRKHSALVVTTGTCLDADLANAAEAAGVPVITCRPDAGRLDLGHVRPVPWGDRLPPWLGLLLGTATGPVARQGQLVGLCGPGGTGVSVVAFAMAQGLAPANDLVLADFARRSHQALLHHLPLGEGGLLDLVARLRGRCLSSSEVRGATTAVDGQPYRLLTGPWRSRHWTAIRSGTFDIALQALRSAFGLVIADITGDFDGEAETGSLEVEERNHPARQVVLTADLVVLVGGPGPTARHATADTHEQLKALGVEGSRILTCTNRVSRAGQQDLALPDVGLIADAALPATFVAPLQRAAAAALRVLPPNRSAAGWGAVAPGTLGLRGEPV